MTREEPVYFAAGEQTLFGMWCPGDRAPDLAVVLLADAGPGGMVGQGAAMVRLGRAIAAAGFGVLRFDYRGVGESGGSPPHLRLDDPFLADLDAALGWLRDRGRTRFVLVGACFGAQTAVAAAHRDDVAGLALLACPVAASLEDADAPVSEIVRAGLRAAASRGLPALACYGSDDVLYRQFAAHDELRDGLDVRVLPGELHSFVDVGVQEDTLRTVTEWIASAIADPALISGRNGA